MSDAVALILHDLKALRRRYQAAGRFMQAAGVQRAIEIARHHRQACQNAPGDAIGTPQATMAPDQRIARL